METIHVPRNPNPDGFSVCPISKLMLVLIRCRVTLVASVLSLLLCVGAAEASITVLSPNGGEAWVTGETHTISWTPGTGANAQIDLFKGGSLYTNIVPSTPNDGSYSWTISTGIPTGSDYQVRIADGSGNDKSDSYFTLVNDSMPNKAVNPNPPNGAVDQPTNKQLSWENGGGATSYGVYSDGQFRGVQTETSYNPGTLAYSSTHHWEIDAQNSAGTTTGDPWSFTVISRIREFITLFYNKALGRAPAKIEVDTWEHGYYDYALTFNIDVRFIGREMGRCFFLSQEYLMRNRTNADFITDCYRAFLGRDPNQWELSSWVNGVWTRGQAMTIFAESGEFANRMDLISTQRGDPTRNFVTTMYIGIFDRLVDSGGLAYWADAMAAAQSKRSKAKEMGLLLFDSAEYRAKNASTEQRVINLYRAFMGRYPGGGEIAYWRDQLDQHKKTFEQVLDVFVNSAEFTGILTKYFGPQGSGADVRGPAKARSWEIYE